MVSSSIDCTFSFFFSPVDLRWKKNVCGIFSKLKCATSRYADLFKYEKRFGIYKRERLFFWKQKENNSIAMHYNCAVVNDKVPLSRTILELITLNNGRVCGPLKKIKAAAIMPLYFRNLSPNDILSRFCIFSTNGRWKIARKKLFP